MHKELCGRQDGPLMYKIRGRAVAKHHNALVAAEFMRIIFNIINKNNVNLE